MPSSPPPLLNCRGAGRAGPSGVRSIMSRVCPIVHHCRGDCRAIASHVRWTHAQPQTIQTSTAGRGHLAGAAAEVHRHRRVGRSCHGQTPAVGNLRGQVSGAGAPGAGRQRAKGWRYRLPAQTAEDCAVYFHQRVMKIPPPGKRRRTAERPRGGGGDSPPPPRPNPGFPIATLLDP